MLEADPRSPRPSTALVLSSGGMRGLAHIGAWKALMEADISVDRIVGSSIGALVGAAIATGVPLEDLEERARTMSRRDVAVPWRWPWWARGTPYPGLLRGDVIRSFVERLLPEDPERLLTIPLDIATVDLDSGELVWFTFRPGSGLNGSPAPSEDGPARLVDAVLASTAIPVFYPPVQINGSSFVDGGVLAPLPVRRAAEGASTILAVDVRSDDEAEAVPWSRKGLLGVSLRALMIATESSNSRQASAPDDREIHRIEPDVSSVGCFDFGCNDRLLTEGFQATRDVIARSTPFAGETTEPDLPVTRRMAG